MRIALIVLLTLPLLGCDAPTPADIEADGQAFYHPSTGTYSTEPPTCADVEAQYHQRLDELGGCPGYVFRDEWCEVAELRTECGREAIWLVQLWASVGTCRDLYWSRGAYCAR